VIYLDYNATTPLHPQVAEAMMSCLRENFGNPSSIHFAGREARAAIDDARDRLAAVLHAKPHELIFTGGGTESDNLAVLGLARSRAGAGDGRHLVTVRTEHHAVLHAFEHLEEKEGFRVTWLPVDPFGVVDLDELTASLRPDTTLVSVMSANNETGTLQPVGEIASLCRERGILFHSDGIQSFGKQPVDPSGFGADAVSLAAHKFYGPKGAGLLYLRSGLAIEKLHYGGFHEGQRRPGTEDVAAIVGMAEAAEIAVSGLESEQARQATLRDRLWEGIRTGIPGAIRNGDPLRSLANTLNVSFPGVDGESLLINLDLAGICASSGSACMVGSISPSHVLLAMGVPAEVAQATARFSLGTGTTETEIEETIDALSRIVGRLQPELV
jgi:cysteine desulfurase